MHEIYEGLRSKLSMSLKELNKTGKLSGAALNELHMVTDTIKNLDKIEMLEGNGYSQGESYASNSYEGGNSNANRRGSTYVQGYYRGGNGNYSREGVNSYGCSPC